MCSGMGVFAALTSQLPYRVNRKYFLHCLHPGTCLVAQGQYLWADFPPVRWHCQLGLQGEVGELCPEQGED